MSPYFPILRLQINRIRHALELLCHIANPVGEIAYRMAFLFNTKVAILT